MKSNFEYQSEEQNIPTTPEMEITAPTACAACVFMGKKKKCCKKFERKSGKYCKSCPKK